MSTRRQFLAALVGIPIAGVAAQAAAKPAKGDVFAPVVPMKQYDSIQLYRNNDNGAWFEVFWERPNGERTGYALVRAHHACDVPIILFELGKLVPPGEIGKWCIRSEYLTVVSPEITPWPPRDAEHFVHYLRDYKHFNQRVMDAAVVVDITGPEPKVLKTRYEKVFLDEPRAGDVCWNPKRVGWFTWTEDGFASV